MNITQPNSRKLLHLLVVSLLGLTVSAPIYAVQESLSLERDVAGSWSVTVSGLQTMNSFYRCQVPFFDDVRYDFSQTPPLIQIYANPVSPPPIGLCVPINPPRPYSQRFVLGVLAPNVYRVVLLDNLATAVLDTRPPAVPVNNAIALLLIGAALAGVGMRSSASRRKP
jgi:hypothetical protein